MLSHSRYSYAFLTNNGTHFYTLFSGLILSMPLLWSCIILYPILSHIQFILVFLDFLSLYQILFQLARHLLFLTFLMFVLDYAQQSIFKQLTSTLQSIWWQLKVSKFQVVPRSICFQLAKYQIIHWRLLSGILRTNSQCISPYFFSMLLTTFPLASCIQAALLQDGVSVHNQIVMFAFEMMLLSLVSLTLIKLYGLFLAVYQSAPYLNLIQPHLRGQACFRDKWKLLTFYEQLHSHSKFAYTAGCIGKITKQNFVYVSMTCF